MLFKPLEALLAPHLGLLWERFNTVYPTCQEVAPLVPAIERFDDSAGMAVTITDKPPLPRVWFVRQDNTGIIQVQRDRFLHNWKKVRPGDEYPRYAKVMDLFREYLATFESFVAGAGLGSIEPVQYELTYVNQIPRGGGFTSTDRIGEVLPDFGWRHVGPRFLPKPERLNWRTSFMLPNRAGRLHVTIRDGVHREDNQPFILLELTARGFRGNGSKNEMFQWFELGHDWIVRAFADLTHADVQHDVWGKTR